MVVANIYLWFPAMLQHMLLVGKRRIVILTHCSKLSQHAVSSEETLMLVWGQELIEMMIGGVRGAHMGMEFLTRLEESYYCSSVLMNAAVCNTCMVPKESYSQTWQHSKSKQWHCIDCRRYLDVMNAWGTV